MSNAGRNFFERTNAVVDSRGVISANEKLLLLCLLRYANPNGYCYPSIATLAANTSLSTRTVIKLKNQLVARGYLKVTARGNRRRGKSNTYHVQVDCLRSAKPCAASSPPPSQVKPVREPQHTSPHDGAEEVLRHWLAIFRANRGTEGHVNGATKRAASELIGIFPVAEVKQMINTAFAKGKYFNGELSVIARSPNAFRGQVRAVGENASRSTRQPLPKHRPEWMGRAE
jgi:hypothetical protein